MTPKDEFDPYSGMTAREASSPLPEREVLLGLLDQLGDALRRLIGAARHASPSWMLELTRTAEDATAVLERTREQLKQLASQSSAVARLAPTAPLGAFVLKLADALEPDGELGRGKPLYAQALARLLRLTLVDVEKEFPDG